MRFLLPLLLIATAHAASPTWSWIAPTACSDGTPITQCTITKYTLYTALQGQPKKVWGTTTGLSLTTGNTPPGIWCGWVTASDTAGESAPSNEACITIAPVPAPPGTTPPTLTTTSTIAYLLVPGADTYGVLIVGTVPLKTPCDTSHQVVLGAVAYYVVPRSSVTLTAPFKNIPALLGVCQ